MAATYTAGQTTPLDRIRFAIIDTDVGNAFLDDLDITSINAAATSEVSAAATCARYVHGVMSKRVNESSGKTSLSLGMQAEAYLKAVVKKLEDVGEGVLPLSSSTPALLAYAGGQSRDENRELRQNNDLVQPRVSNGQDDALGTGRSPGGWSYGTRDSDWWW